MRDIKKLKSPKHPALFGKRAGATGQAKNTELRIERGVFIAWQAPEYEYQQKKDVSWYWLSLIIAIILSAFAVWQRNFLFAVFVIISWLIVIKLTGRFPTIWEFRIDEKGISVGNESGNNKFYPFSDIDFFDVHPAGEDYKELALKFKSRFTPLLKINIHSVDEEKIKAFLLKFLRQKEIEPSLIDSLARLIRF